jgi:hypothetical protein
MKPALKTDIKSVLAIAVGGIGGLAMTAGMLSARHDHGRFERFDYVQAMPLCAGPDIAVHREYEVQLGHVDHAEHLESSMEHLEATAEHVESTAEHLEHLQADIEAEVEAAVEDAMESAEHVDSDGDSKEYLNFRGANRAAERAEVAAERAAIAAERASLACAVSGAAQDHMMQHAMEEGGTVVRGADGEVLLEHSHDGAAHTHRITANGASAAEIEVIRSEGDSHVEVRRKRRR